ncbi:hypothetical protein GR160_17000 [Flavobacterium sp. Sd200]|uniref:hypothetical protein n=1 Tax=Flavobacterium sp. Sd200 TaxID=2692211 RepID=UPI001369588C|nr:hypothetical protein [Flavobacterium sp. Sd200]MXN92927.1 hypothetical protein [Flavobacterium sp. Sd200]
MALHYRLLFILALFFAIAPLQAQVAPPARDTVKEKRDQMYQQLENYSKRKKFTRFLHKLIFRSVQPKELGNSRKKIKNQTPELQTTYETTQGKIVRNIVIETLDPFGLSVTDTARKPRNGIERFGNRVHLKTKQITIRNLLLFKKNRPLDSLLIQDSERLLRRQRYIRRVAITPRPAGNSKDSVDVYIRVLDSWSLIPNGSASSSGTSVNITERNFFGLGHEFENDFDKRFNTGRTSYLARYTVPNIMNTYINATVNYQIWESYNNLKSFGLERDFFSAYTKWAGGAYVESRYQRDSLPNLENENVLQDFKSNSQDFWGGYAFKIYEGESEENRTTRLVTTGRYYARQYLESPSEEFDPRDYYASETLYMGSVGLTSRKFVQDKFLFNYDIVEDIPIGKVYSGTIGTQNKNAENRVYLGARYAFGNYYKWGYFSTDFQLGSFFYGERTDETSLRIEALYFSNIRNWGSWRFRHFVKPIIVMGDHRIPIITDQLNLNAEFGFDKRLVQGTKKVLLTLQTQSYSPWNVLGFRLNPFANFTMGIVGTEDRKLFKSPVYTRIGLGLLIYNDYLIFNSFQLSVAFYPTIPGNGNNIFRTNTMENTDITLPDFQIAKPGVVPYY